MKTLQILIGIVAITSMIFSIVAINQKSMNLAGVTNYDELDVTDGYKVDGSTIINGSGSITAVDGTFTGGTVTVTTANTATSTAIIGCVQTYATSTASPIKLTLGKEASTATTTYYGGTSKGIIYWEYGTCPNL